MAAFAFVQVFCPGELDGLYEESDGEEARDDDDDLIQLLGSGQLETIKLCGFAPPKKNLMSVIVVPPFARIHFKKNTHLRQLS